VAFLSDGDITKRDSLLWGFTVRECKPYFRVRERQALFREAVIAFIVGPEKGTTEDAYCKTCKTAAKRSGKALDCASCNKNITEVTDNGGQ